MSDFPAFGKIPRYFRELVVTEKIDGDNGLVYVSYEDQVPEGAVATSDGLAWVRAGSRTRWITPGDDNAGFAAWVHAHADGLSQLGAGRYYGEWWGAGIRRRYGLAEKRFSLFNTGRWFDGETRTMLLPGSRKVPDVPGLCVVPVLETGEGEWVIEAAKIDLITAGSYAAPGFMNPEGVVVFHTAANSYFKVTLDNDAKPKGNAA